MRRVVIVVPGAIDTRTGGYEYDRRMAAGLRALGWDVEIRELDGSFPHPTPAALRAAERVLAAIPDRHLVVVDGLALGAMPAQVEREAPRLRIGAIVHLPLAAHAGLVPAAAAEFEESERRALGAATFVIVTGRPTVDAVVGYGVRRSRIALVEPGTDRAPLARGSGAGVPPHLVCVAALTAGKGHAVLFRALARLADREWTLTCAGSTDRDPQTVRGLRALLRNERLEHRIFLIGELDAERLAALYDRADLFVLATLHETYGMAVAEALARGLPIVSTRTGAIPDLAGPAEDCAGLIVEPGDVAGLAEALAKAVGDAGVRERLAAAGRRARERLSTWEEAAARMDAALSGRTLG